MAKIVIGIGTPHSPMFPAISEREGDRSRITGLFSEIRRRFELARPDLIVMFTSDHFVGFFYDNLPAFCVGAFDTAEGPWELSRAMPKFKVRGRPAFARALLSYGMDHSFDLASSEELKLDHSVFVPLYFIAPEMQIPIVTIHIRGHQVPLPRADRCHALGRALRSFINEWQGSERIAVVASGSFSLEVGGPKAGRIDEKWWKFVVNCLSSGAATALVEQATTERMQAAGNTGGELLNWIALLGAMNDEAPQLLEPDAQPPHAYRDAHAYATWGP
jgi:aromatic ring-opening dioxygenase catalytic subunit (LigB family)